MQGLSAVLDPMGKQLAPRLASLRGLTEAGIPVGSRTNEVLTRSTLCVQGVSAVLDPNGKQLAPLLASLRGLIEAGIPRRKPKVAKGTRDFHPNQMTLRELMFEASVTSHICIRTSILKQHTCALTSPWTENVSLPLQRCMSLFFFESCQWSCHL